MSLRVLTASSVDWPEPQVELTPELIADRALKGAYEVLDTTARNFRKFHRLFEQGRLKTDAEMPLCLTALRSLKYNLEEVSAFLEMAKNHNPNISYQKEYDLLEIAYDDLDCLDLRVQIAMRKLIDYSIPLNL